MKNFVLVIFLSPIATLNHAFGSPTPASKDQSIECIAADGLTLSIPDPSHFYMQPLILSNDYVPDLLKNLIDRKNHPNPQDHDLYLNVGFNDCVRVSDREIHCHGQGFGNADYSYEDGQDHLTVSTSVSGKIDLDLVQDSQDNYELSFTATNTNLPGNHQLSIKKIFGPKNDPNKTSLTPWSPGCSVPAP